MGWFTLGKGYKAYKTFTETKGGVKAITGVAPKVSKKGSPKERKIIADTLREHRASESHKGYKKMMKQIPHDLTHMKGILKK